MEVLIGQPENQKFILSSLMRVEKARVLSKDNIETLSLCKRMMERGECPLVVGFDPHKGAQSCVVMHGAPIFSIAKEDHNNANKQALKNVYLQVLEEHEV
ncbi:Histone-lysine N-methyltransferase ATXR6 [Platanthera guangdongensis]|uniref:Histone-lysine N-methyltransferase ATXR6 n=1 Tax=Platanthera guangdongensis TaxID=2320717 RepID=A0ABR2MHJ0_9ASPA